MNRPTRREIEQWLKQISGETRVHLVGMGGCGMSGLAHLLLDMGFAVTGSDLCENADLRQLQNRGAGFSLGHNAEKINENRPVLVVYSSAVRLDNSELARANQLGIPIVRRAILLSALVNCKRMVCVAGMHGKTTTTAMLAHTLEQLGNDVGFAVGAKVPQLGRHARMPSAENSFFVLEADESDGTLREFHSEHSIVLNIDEEHLDFYENFESVCDEFIAFGKQTSGRLIYCADDPLLPEIYANNLNSISYGFNPAADYQAEIISSKEFIVRHHQQSIGQFRIGLFGEQNISNAVAVVAFLHVNGFAPDNISEALCKFKGVNRRQQELTCDHRYRIFDDYGHHPREIRATLSALNEQCSGRLLVAFQPHRYTRTKHLLGDFAQCFDGVDLLWITEVYAASEPPIDNINGQRLAEAISKSGQPAAFAATLEILRDKIRNVLRPGDTILFLGAGDITQVAHQLVKDMHMKEMTHTTELRGLLSSQSTVMENEPLGRHTTLGVGGPAEIYIEPAGEKELAVVLRYAADKGVPVFILGRGSNLLVRDGGIRGIVISLRHESFSGIEVIDAQIHCGAGARLNHIANAARDAGLKGMEFMEGIPGCLGGALRMNAGAWGGATFEQVIQVRYMSYDGQIEERAADQMGAVYRSCSVLGDHIALGAVLQGIHTEKELVRSTMNYLRKQRTESQPHYRSAGCMFKNPEGFSAGKLVDECRLKGLSEGGAKVSEQHGNFIVNDGTASAEDVISLIETVRVKVREIRGIELQTEVQIVGER